MSIYGVRIGDTGNTDLEWFTTDADLPAGRYRLRRHRSSSSVFVSETIAGLILQAGASLQRVEDQGSKDFASPDIPPACRKHLEDEYTEGLMAQLTETSSIWHNNPTWVRKLELD